MRRLSLLVGLVVVGCSKTNSLPADPRIANPSTDPAHATYEQIRSGFVQMGNSLESLGEALETAKSGQSSSDKALKEACAGIAELLDVAGSRLSDYTEPPESFDAFNEKFKEYDDSRIKAIEGANDALHEIDEAKGYLADLQADPKLEKEQIVLDLTDLLADSEKSLREAIEALGGRIEEPSSY